MFYCRACRCAAEKAIDKLEKETACDLTAIWTDTIVVSATGLRTATEVGLETS